MPRLHLLDGTYELFRAFYAMPSERSPQGQEVGAIRGLIGSVLSLLREPGVTHLAAATDHVIESFRNQLFPGYKTGDGIDPDLWSQFPLAEQALSALGVVVWPMVDFEADDALATAAARFAPEVDEVVILSPDKDLCQSVCDGKVITQDRRQRKTYDAAGVVQKLGVPPAAVADLLALVGDTADGIPGLPGFGMKTAAALLTVFGSLEAIPGDASAWPVTIRGAKKLVATLTEQRSAAGLYKTLATLRVDVPLQESLADLEWHGADRARYQAFCSRLGFGNLADRPHRWQAPASDLLVPTNLP